MIIVLAASSRQLVVLKFIIPEFVQGKKKKKVNRCWQPFSMSLAVALLSSLSLFGLLTSLKLTLV